TYVASPSRSDVTPTTAPAGPTRAAPPKAELYGATKSARSSMYSHDAAKPRMDLTVPGVAMRAPSSSMPTVPVMSPTAILVESPSEAAGQGPGPSSLTTPSPDSRSRPATLASTLRPSRSTTPPRAASMST